MGNSFDAQRRALRKEWRTIAEFPKYEINLDGKIRYKESLIMKGTYEDGYGQEVVQLTRDGKRYLRTVKRLIRVAFSV